MKPKIPPILLMLKEACEKYGYKFKLIDNWSNNLVEVSDGKTSFFASNSRPGLYPLNARFATSLVGDKTWTYKLLSQKGYKIPKGDYFFVRPNYRELRGDGREFNNAFTYAKKLRYPVFVKPNNLSLGTDAKLINSRKELKQHLDLVSKRSHIALIQKFIISPEYRIFAVDGEVQFLYQHIPSIKGAPANVASGGYIKNYTTDISIEIQQWAKKLTHHIHLRVWGADIFAKDLKKTKDYIIIEINSSPSLSGIYELGEKEKALSIWKTIIKKYFKEAKN